MLRTINFMVCVFYHHSKRVKKKKRKVKIELKLQRTAQKLSRGGRSGVDYCFMTFNLKSSTDNIKGRERFSGLDLSQGRADLNIRYISRISR